MLTYAGLHTNKETLISVVFSVRDLKPENILLDDHGKSLSEIYVELSQSLVFF